MFSRAKPGSSGKVRQIVVYASKLAAVAGMHRYVSREELEREFLSQVGKLDPSDRFVSREELGRLAVEDLPPDRRDAVNDTMRSRYDSTVAIANAIDALSEKTESPIPADVCSYVRSALFTRHGIEQEDAVRHRAEELRRQTIQKAPNLFVVAPRPIATLDCGVEVFVGGKNDGTFFGGGGVVEVKTRLRAFLGTPLYDLVQVHAYMSIAETRESVLIESLDGQQRHHDIAFDDDLWVRVSEAVREFMNGLLGRRATA